MLHYHIKPKNLGAHLIAVEITVKPQTAELLARLPKWIPGSYKIRDYSRFIQCFSVSDEAGKPLNWHKTDSDSWLIDSAESINQKIHICYEVYAYDLSVRGAYLDDTRFFFNHCCVALDIVDYSAMPRQIMIESVDNWPVFTALPAFDEEKSEKKSYRANSYEHQIDCPIESAKDYQLREFEVAGIRHQFLLTGHLDADYDLDGITAQLQRICQVEAQCFKGLPLKHYLFMTYVEANQYGGLEHKNCVAQMASPEMIKKKGQKNSKACINFMGLCSHEYFHLWNIKRLQPKDFKPYDLYRAQNTEMLWFFEGFTSYYDELFLLRAGVVDAPTFLSRQAENLSRVLAVPGRLIQSLAASSFDAWTKLYQADANSPNNMVSYYSKGAVFALYLDLFLRKHSRGNASTDDVMRDLWENFAQKDLGIDEDDVFGVCAKLIPAAKHQTLAAVFVDGLHDTKDLPLAEMLSDFNVNYCQNPAQTQEKLHTSYSGFRVDDKTGKISFLDAHSQAATVGVSVNDEVLAINDRQSTAVSFSEWLDFGHPDQCLKLTLSRRGRVLEKHVQLQAVPKNRITFELGQENALNRDWLAQWV